MNIVRSYAVVLLLTLLAACGPQPAASPPTATTAPPTATPLPARPTATPSATAAPAAITPCAFMWAYQEAPGVPEAARAALEAAGLTPTAVSAQVFGETCGERFLAMGTTIEAELPVADLADEAALGELVVAVTEAIESIGATPGPNPEARLRFTSGGEMRALKYSLAIARRQIDGGLRGAELLRALGYQP